MKRATFVLEQVSGSGAVQRLYSVDYVDEPASEDRSDHILVSAVCAIFTGPETYIFAADKDGEVTNWLEMDGSFRGSLDHEEALRLGGYELQ